MRTILIVLAALLVPTEAHADWHVATSENFVVYADDKASDLQQFAEMLEKYHAAMEFITRRNTEPPSPSNRVTIYAVGGQRDIRELYGDRRSRVAGFYQSRAGGSVAFVPDIRNSRRDLDFSVIILLHEYAHHFLISSSRFGMPRWMSEGAAEFFASAKFEKDGRVWVGRAANHRAAELIYSDDVTIEELFDNDLYEQRRSRGHDEFYGRSWTLYHYLTFSQERRGQLFAYGRAIAGGENSLTAAREIFGDLRELDKELERYLQNRRITAFSLKPELLSPSPVSVEKLTEAHGKMMPIIIRSKRGVTREQALELLPEAQEVAARYPNDPHVLAALAEAEHDAGNYEAAIAAADRAIASNPNLSDSYVQKGYALFAMADDAEDVDAAYRQAMVPFSQLNQMENDHPLPLIYYYRSYQERAMEPSENARHAIERAAELAPFDKSLWMTVGFMQAWEGKTAIAAQSLSSVANDPHGGEAARVARAYIAALKAAPEGEPFDLSSVFVPPEIDLPEIETATDS